MSETYTISTVDDFLKVPENRQADCLAEFADFLALARDLTDLSALVGETLGFDATAKIGAFVWIDDGRKDRTIRLHAGNEREDAGEGKQCKC